MPTSYYAPFSAYRVNCAHCAHGVFSSGISADARVLDLGGGETSELTTATFSYSARRGVFRNTCRNCQRDARRERAATTGSRRVPGTVLGLGRRFGVELELVFPNGTRRESVLEALAAAGLVDWRIKGDATISGGNGMEVVSPVLAGETGIAAVRTACEVLTRMGARPNVSCGMHVHHDSRDMTVAQMKALARSWYRNQDIVDGLVSESRRAARSNHYCRRLDESDMAQIDAIRDLRSLGRLDRYRSLNLASYGRHATVEIRQHQGTVDAEKVTSWIRFGQAMIDTAKVEGALPETSRVRDLFARLGERLDETAATYLLGRAVQFGAVTV